MFIETRRMTSMRDANQNFSKVARLTEENETILILKNNRPRFVLQTIESFERQADMERFELLARRIIAKYRVALEGLGK